MKFFIKINFGIVILVRLLTIHHEVNPRVNKDFQGSESNTQRQNLRSAIDYGHSLTADSSRASERIQFNQHLDPYPVNLQHLLKYFRNVTYFNCLMLFLCTYCL